MAIRGRSIDVLVKPQVVKDVDEIEALAPIQVDIRNSRISTTGFWRKRNGYALLKTLSENSPIVTLIPQTPGYAVNKEGTIYDLSSGSIVHNMRVSTPRVTWAVSGETIVLCGGESPATIDPAGDLSISVFPPTTAPTASVRARANGSIAKGTYVYAYSYVTSLYLETGLGPESAELVVSDDGVAVDVSNLLPSSDVDQIAVRLYRSEAKAGGDREWKLANYFTGRDPRHYLDETATGDLANTPPGSGEGELRAPQGARYVVALFDRLVMAGHHPTRFAWSNVAAPRVWPGENYASVRLDGGTIQNIKAFGRDLYIFKDNNIEVWAPGRQLPWVRSTIIERGCAAPYSVVFTNNQLHWLGDDGELYVLDRGTPTPISFPYSKELRKLSKRSEVYGLEFPEEHCIRWFAPSDGKCFVYDYINKTIVEDNQHDGTNWSFFPIASATQINGKTYIGDHNATGKVYEMSDNYADDAGDPITVRRRLNILLTNDADAARVHRLRLRLKRGVAAVAASVVRIRWRLDRGAYSDFMEIPLSGVDRTPYFDIHNLGLGREIELDFEEVNSSEFIVTHAYLTIKQFGWRRGTGRKSRADARA